MNYLITMDNQEPFLTNWFEYENNFQEGAGMIVYNLLDITYTTDGVNWQDIEEDSL